MISKQTKESQSNSLAHHLLRQARDKHNKNDNDLLVRTVKMRRVPDCMVKRLNIPVVPTRDGRYMDAEVPAPSNGRIAQRGGDSRTIRRGVVDLEAWAGRPLRCVAVTRVVWAVRLREQVLLQPPAENACFAQLSLCLSRACLAKMIVFV